MAGENRDAAAADHATLRDMALDDTEGIPRPSVKAESARGTGPQGPGSAGASAGTEGPA